MVSNITPSYHTISLPTNHHLGYHSRRPYDTTEPPSTSCSLDADRNRATMAQISSFWPKTCNPSLHSRKRDPTTAVTLSTPPHRLPPSPTTAVSNGVPQTRNPSFFFYNRTAST